MEHLIFDLSIILVGAAALSALAVLFKQPIIIAYIVCGILVGPWGLGLVKHVEFIEAISHLGITLLLFLAGLCLHPQKLIELFRKTSLVTLANCVFSFVLAYGFSRVFGLSHIDSLCVGLALMFSSTILVIKLLPTTTLHQKRMGAVCISVLILQDLLAVGVLIFMRSLSNGGVFVGNFFLLLAKMILLVVILLVLENMVLRKIMMKMDRIQEFLFILGLAWCFGVASISHHMGLLFESGAFFAGVALARHRISFVISEKLKPLRDFFLVLFFFALGAKLNILMMLDVLVPALVLAALFLFLKPLIFRKAFLMAGEKKNFARETSFRLGQLSEFSLLIAMLALQMGTISTRASQLIQLVTILTFIGSSYWVVFKFPTPIGVSDKLIKD